MPKPQLTALEELDMLLAQREAELGPNPSIYDIFKPRTKEQADLLNDPTLKLRR